MAKELKVLGARCIVEEEKKQEKTKSGIIMPNANKEPTFKGKVIAVGQGARFEDGTLCPMEVSVGDEVLYAQFAGSPVEVDGKTFIILNERDILAIIADSN